MKIVEICENILIYENRFLESRAVWVPAIPRF